MELVIIKNSVFRFLSLQMFCFRSQDTPFVIAAVGANTKGRDLVSKEQSIVVPAYLEKTIAFYWISKKAIEIDTGMAEKKP